MKKASAGSRRLQLSKKRIYQGFLAYFVVIFIFMIWPVYPFFSRIRPMVLGLPFSLVYLAVLLFLTFVGLAVLYRWEDRNGDLE